MRGIVSQLAEEISKPEIKLSKSTRFLKNALIKERTYMSISCIVYIEYNIETYLWIKNKMKEISLRDYYIFIIKNK